MSKTITSIKTLDLFLRRAEIIVTAAGYRLVCHSHEIESVNGAPVSSAEIVHEEAVSSALAAEIDRVINAKRAKDYA